MKNFNEQKKRKGSIELGDSRPAMCRLSCILFQVSIEMSRSSFDELDEVELLGQARLETSALRLTQY